MKKEEVFMDSSKYLTDEKGKLIVSGPEGGKYEIDVLFGFRVPDLGKEYVAYTASEAGNNDPDSDVAVIVGEVVRNEENDDVTILGVCSDEEVLVSAFFNDLMEQLGGKE